jgi:hypothetical protein
MTTDQKKVAPDVSSNDKKDMIAKLCACLNNNDLDGMDALLKQKIVDLNTFVVNFTKDGDAFEKVNLTAYFAIHGNAEGVSRAVAAGAPVDAGTGRYDPFIVSAYFGHFDAVRVLMKLGRDPCEKLKSYGDKNVFDILTDRGKHEESRKTKALFFEHRDELLTRETGLLVVSRAFGDKCLQDVFNFEAGHKTSLMRTAHNGKVEAMTQTDFSQISNKDYLNNMRALFAARGGTADNGTAVRRVNIVEPADIKSAANAL